MTDPTRIDIATDPLTKRMCGTTYHGGIDFDVPFMTQVAPNLWQGGCEGGLVLPTTIKHVVSLYPWERYRIDGIVNSELYVRMFDAESQDLGQVNRLARWVNDCRQTGPVLVHCQAGLNRSSLIVARALYLSDGTPGAEIVEQLRETRSPAVLCNPAFAAEVVSWR
ncbi:protein-tyrosine phosphatase family protein [Mycobacteroides abscessus]|uniref:protein-tyrosine phosphatase family protein n=1 Tax=Mycobacteroides abscessus TaxID=36809 RepID=UPI001F221114|nr:dual specificity protein phosphatase family protein [Mycobacteroides abscessus]